MTRTKRRYAGTVQSWLFYFICTCILFFIFGFICFINFIELLFFSVALICTSFLSSMSFLLIYFILYYFASSCSNLIFSVSLTFSIFDIFLFFPDMSSLVHLSIFFILYHISFHYISFYFISFHLFDSIYFYFLFFFIIIFLFYFGRALIDVWSNVQESNRTEGDKKISEVVVMVVGAGRGPLVCATLRWGEVCKQNSLLYNTQMRWLSCWHHDTPWLLL